MFIRVHTACHQQTCRKSLAKTSIVSCIHSFFHIFITVDSPEQRWESIAVLVRVMVKTTDKYALLCSDSENESVVDSDEAEEEGSDDELEDEEEEGKDWDELEEEAKRYTAMTPDFCLLSVC